jgi:hypothetical protein
MTVKLRPAHVADIFRLQEIERAAAELFRDSDRSTSRQCP